MDRNCMSHWRSVLRHMDAQNWRERNRTVYYALRLLVENHDDYEEIGVVNGRTIALLNSSQSLENWTFHITAYSLLRETVSKVPILSDVWFNSGLGLGEMHSRVEVQQWLASKDPADVADSCFVFLEDYLKMVQKLGCAVEQDLVMLNLANFE